MTQSPPLNFSWPSSRALVGNALPKSQTLSSGWAWLLSRLRAKWHSKMFSSLSPGLLQKLWIECGVSMTSHPKVASCRSHSSTNTELSSLTLDWAPWSLTYCHGWPDFIPSQSSKFISIFSSISNGDIFYLTLAITSYVILGRPYNLSLSCGNNHSHLKVLQSYKVPSLK